MEHSSILDITRSRGEVEEERRPAAVVVIAMRAEVMTKAIAEEMTGVVGQVGRQVDLVGQEAVTDLVGDLVGRQGD